MSQDLRSELAPTGALRAAIDGSAGHVGIVEQVMIGASDLVTR